jgi:deoxyribonuclease-4
MRLSAVSPSEPTTSSSILAAPAISPTEVGIENCAAALRAATAGLESAMMRGGLQILIENTAGQGGQIGRSFAEVREILDRCSDRRWGCAWIPHIHFAAGYDWRDETASRAAFQDLTERLVWLGCGWFTSTTQNRLFSQESTATGTLAQARLVSPGLARVLNHPGLADCPFILETPQDSPEDDGRNLAAARSLVRPD